MLIKSKNNIYSFIYYHEASSIILIQYRTQYKRAYFYVNPVFFQTRLLPLIKTNGNFRALLMWALNNNLATEIDFSDHRVVELNDEFLRVVK